MNRAVMNKIDLLLENASDNWYRDKVIATMLTNLTPAEKAKLQTIGGRMGVAGDAGLKMAKYGALGGAAGGALGGAYAGLTYDDHNDDLGTTIRNSLIGTLGGALGGSLMGGVSAGVGASLGQYANAHTAANMSDKDAARIAKQAREDYGNIWAENAKKNNALR